MAFLSMGVKVGSIHMRLIVLEIDHVDLGLDFLMVRIIFQMLQHFLSPLGQKNVATNLSRHAVAYRNSFQWSDRPEDLNLHGRSSNLVNLCINAYVLFHSYLHDGEKIFISMVTLSKLSNILLATTSVTVDRHVNSGPVKFHHLVTYLQPWFRLEFLR